MLWILAKEAGGNIYKVEIFQKEIKLIIIKIKQSYYCLETLK